MEQFSVQNLQNFCQIYIDGVMMKAVLGVS